MRCDTCGLMSCTARRGGIVASTPRLNSRSGELCTTIRPWVKSSKSGSPLHAKETGNFTLCDRLLDALGSQGELKGLKNTFS